MESPEHSGTEQPTFQLVDVPPQEQQAKPQGKSQKVTIKEYWYQFLVLLPACEQFPWNHKFFTIKLNKQQKESRCFLYLNVFF